MVNISNLIDGQKLVLTGIPAGDWVQRMRQIAGHIVTFDHIEGDTHIYLKECKNIWFKPEELYYLQPNSIFFNDKEIKINNSNAKQIVIALTKIIWDTEGVLVDNLPTELIIRNPSEAMLASVEGENDNIQDYLFDTYGFLVERFNAEILILV